MLPLEDGSRTEPTTLYRLASQIFDYIDRISAESVEGYAAEQSATLAER